MTDLQILILGPPQIIKDEMVVGHGLSQKALGLLAYLVMCPSHGYSREKLAGMFWGETDDVHAKYNLRRALWELRKVINPPDAPADHLIQYKKGTYAFNRSSDCWIDVNVFDGVTTKDTPTRISETTKESPRSQPSVSSSTKNLQDAVQLYRGKLLEGCRPRGCPEFMDWLFLERSRLEQQFIQSLRTLAVARAIQSDYQGAVAYYEKVLSVDPLHEVTHCDLMVANYLLGKRDRALEQYLEFSRILRKHLELEPLPKTNALYQSIRNDTLELEGSSYWLTKKHESSLLSAPSRPFVGRKPELVQLEQIFEATRQHSGHMIVVSGEAGVGKTRLTEEFLCRISEFNPIILRARCSSQEQGLLYQPIIDALRAYLSTADFSYIKKLNHLWLAEVAKLIPELHSYLPHLPLSLALVPDQDRNRLFEGLAQFITHLSKRGVLILFLDDIHATDLPTFELIHYLASRLSSSRVLLLCTLRDEALVDRPSLSALQRELMRNKRVRLVKLSRFTEREVMELLNRTIGTSAKLPELGRRFYLKTGGNPFFLMEMLKAREEGQRETTDDTSVPPNVRDVIRHRLNRLDEHSRRIVTLASVIGRQFGVTTIEKFFEGDKHSLLTTLDQSQMRGWIVEPSDVRPGIYEFSHTLVRDAVYQTLSAARKADLHHRVGLSLEISSSEEDEYASVLAHHFWKAGEPNKGARYALRAASYARRLYANSEAVTHYLRVLNFADQGELGLSATELVEIRRHLGQCYQLLGKYDDAIDVYKRALPESNLSDANHRRIYFQMAIAYDLKGEYDQALELFTEIGTHLSKPEDTVSKLEAAMNLRGMAGVYLHREQSHQALAFCRQALAHVEEGNIKGEGFSTLDRKARERVAVYEVMADSYFHLGDYEAAENHYMLALEAARGQDQRAQSARLLIGVGKVARRRGNYVQAGNYAQESLGLCSEIGDISGEASSYGLLGDVAYNRGNFEKAISCYEQALSTYRQVGDQHGIADFCLSLGFVKIDMGEIDQAENYLQESLSIGENLNSRLILIRAQYHLARVARARGNLDEARSQVETALQAAQKAGIRLLEAAGHHLLGDILAQLKQPAQGEAHMIKGLRLFENLGDRFESAWTLRTYAQLLKKRGDLSRARPQLQRAAELFAELGAERELHKTEHVLSQLDNR